MFCIRQLEVTFLQTSLVSSVFKFQLKLAISVKVSLIIEEDTFKHVELNNFKLILLQTSAVISKWGNFIPKY